jgi:MoaA/NifB/PqqE/SkfB family radical SAM enzyme
MQKEHLKLEEIIWEITQECKNGCTYCGSKEGRNIPTKVAIIENIADEIAKFPPKSINISGGDPLLVPLSTHDYIVKKLRGVGTTVKIIINPRSFREYDTLHSLKILGLYDWIGVSINEKDEIARYRKYINGEILNPKTTIITNFNINNVFLFDEIKTLVVQNNLTWQIQFTMYKDSKDERALYNNEAACTFLYNQIKNAMKEKVKIVPADNMNNGECSAGKYSLGILADGTVIPCLSMRSWVKSLNEIIENNILLLPLEIIWKNGFSMYRFKEFKCCKDHCNNKCFKDYNVEITTNVEKIPNWGDIFIPEDAKYKKDWRETYVYGVTPNTTIVYGVFNTLTVDNHT